MTYRPPAGSLAASVCSWLALYPARTLTTEDIIGRFVMDGDTRNVHAQLIVALGREGTPAANQDMGDERALGRLNIARQQKDLTVSKSRVRLREPMYQLPALAIGHHSRFTPHEAAPRQKLKRRNTDPAEPITSLGKEFDPARVDPVLRVLVGSHFDLFGAPLVSEQKCRAPLGRPVHQKAFLAPICSFDCPRRKLSGIRSEIGNEECRP
ncbi:MAG: hypothetical protein QM777_08715 [Pseudorhodoferax sp.]